MYLFLRVTNKELLGRATSHNSFFPMEVPWAEYIHYPGQSKEEKLATLNGMSTSQRRAFKTHLRPPVLPLDARVKYLICVRNPLDTIASYLFINSITPEFTTSWELKFISVDTWEAYHKFIFEFGGEPYWPFINAWWPHRFDRNVLMFHYSDLCSKPAENIKKISSFLGTATSDDFINLVVERTSFATMKKSEEKFEAIFSGKKDEISLLQHGGMMRQGGVGVKEVPTDFKEAYLKLCDERCISKEQLEWCRQGGELPKN